MGLDMSANKGCQSIFHPRCQLYWLFMRHRSNARCIFSDARVSRLILSFSILLRAIGPSFPLDGVSDFIMPWPLRLAALAASRRFAALHASCRVVAALLRFMYCRCVNHALTLRAIILASFSSWLLSSLDIWDMALSRPSEPQLLMTVCSSESAAVLVLVRLRLCLSMNPTGASSVASSFICRLSWRAHLSCSDKDWNASWTTGSDECDTSSRLRFSQVEKMPSSGPSSRLAKSGALAANWYSRSRIPALLS
mmetsp:Transcript_7985/g.29866  ORF Transcript_7985/g.29866 Transcript_7985/m.29866 type:complete len:252 (-) Transcript_7985:1884-2639(-)